MSPAPDLYLRQRSKLRPTDLWLHPAGPTGAGPPPIRDSGTLITIALLDGVEALADQGGLVTVAVLTGSDAQQDSGIILSRAVLVGQEALADAGLLISIATHTGLGELVGEAEIVEAVKLLPPDLWPCPVGCGGKMRRVAGEEFGDDSLSWLSASAPGPFLTGCTRCGFTMAAQYDHRWRFQ